MNNLNDLRAKLKRAEENITYSKKQGSYSVDNLHRLNAIKAEIYDIEHGVNKC